MRAGSGNRTSPSMARIRSRRAAGGSRVCVASTSSICRPQHITGLSAVIGSWKIIAIRAPRRVRSRAAPARSRSSPSSEIRPADATSSPLGRRPMTACAVTDLPEPDSPTTHRISPRPTSRLTSSTANGRSPPRGSATESPSISRTGPWLN
jgi:hypothetical protein